MDVRERFDQIDGLREHRPRSWWVIRGIAVLIACVLVAAGAYIANYQPLVRGVLGMGAPCLEDGSWAAVDVVIATCTEPGSVIEWGFSWRNDGPFAITILDTGWDGEEGLAPLVPLELRSYDFATYHMSRGGELPPARPAFDELETSHAEIAPGETRVFLFRATHLGCRAAGGGILTGTRLTYRVLSFTRQELIDLPIVVDPCFADRFERAREG